jgi:UDP-N-acetyl-D-glucosamine dehydrogenase
MGRLVVIGQGCVRLPLPLRAAQRGFLVTGSEAMGSIVEAPNAGGSRIGDNSGDQVTSAWAGGYCAWIAPRALPRKMWSSCAS